VILAWAPLSRNRCRSRAIFATVAIFAGYLGPLFSFVTEVSSFVKFPTFVIFGFFLAHTLALQLKSLRFSPFFFRLQIAASAFNPEQLCQPFEFRVQRIAELTSRTLFGWTPERLSRVRSPPLSKILKVYVEFQPWQSFFRPVLLFLS